MPQQAPFKLIKRCRLHERRGYWKPIPPVTRGLYVLYKERPPSANRARPIFEVVYIGVAGIAKKPTSGIGGRVKGHNKHKDGWSHYSFFEVHDNISREEILELEGLLLLIFSNDPRIKLANSQLGSPRLRRLARKPAWTDL
jgi:hypothetical protein